jgi:hypothetical protein
MGGWRFTGHKSFYVRCLGGRTCSSTYLPHFTCLLQSPFFPNTLFFHLPPPFGDPSPTFLFLFHFLHNILMGGKAVRETLLGSSFYFWNRGRGTSLKDSTGKQWQGWLSSMKLYSYRELGLAQSAKDRRVFTSFGREGVFCM